jgi:hypothetical protein
MCIAQRSFWFDDLITARGAKMLTTHYLDETRYSDFDAFTPSKKGRIYRLDAMTFLY